ncbi:MAG: Gfo/Idh/MocA family oxidoreductase [Akkermansiaceae bacterium]|nr:Gfo/Idh/MocA family oxidoreductase [Akkermansiaceae bacterium]MCP5551809.1 Gfo/Idh/MocA family oxidoreductase [Akkermansiaceae bacterium]
MVRYLGIILNGVTGRMGTNQHLFRSIRAIEEQGGVRVSDDLTLMPRPILTGRNEAKLAALANRAGGLPFTTDIDAALADPENAIFFDASGTLQRAGFIERAVAAGKAVYCEKPTAVETAEALRLARLCEDAGLKNGVVQDKLWLPGIRKFMLLRDQGFFGRILSVRGEFGYWVFTGEHEGQPAQRPSWNYRKEDGGGIIVDMLCHWRYVIDNCFGPVSAVSCRGATHVPERWDERGAKYACTADDACYATMETANGVVCQFNSAWTVRVRRDDLFTMQVDGTHGSAVVGLRQCRIQAAGATPRPVWNPDIEQPIDFFGGWQEVPDATGYDNAFKAQWELFLRHVALDEPFPWTLREGAKGVQLAELGLQSWAERRWLDVGEL